MGWECSSSSSDATPACCSSSGGDSMATAIGFQEQKQCQLLWNRPSHQHTTHLQQHGWAALAAAVPGSCMVTVAWGLSLGRQACNYLGGWCSRCQLVPSLALLAAVPVL